MMSIWELSTMSG